MFAAAISGLNFSKKDFSLGVSKRGQGIRLSGEWTEARKATAGECPLAKGAMGLRMRRQSIYPVGAGETPGNSARARFIITRGGSAPPMERRGRETDEREQLSTPRMPSAAGRPRRHERHYAAAELHV